MEKTAFVTGSASGLGRAIALRLAREGMRVVVADIDEKGAAEVTEEIARGGGRASAVYCDVRRREDIAEARDHALAAAGAIDVLVNNAGFDIPGFFLQSDPATWRDLLAVNLEGVINCTYEIAPAIIERCGRTGYGRIVNIASDAGRVGALGEAVYSAAKGGVIAFSKSIARELARDKVTVNAVCPGPAETPMTAALRETDVGKMMMERMVRATPLRRLVEGDEVAAAVAYFASEDARFTTGQVLSLSGGLTMHG